jgi:4-hydroxythreonine-4-phosphate dehydrogenase
MHDDLPRLALIPGEPAGIGPELCVRLAQTELPARLVAYGDADLLLRAATRLGLPLQLHDHESLPHRPGALALRQRALRVVERPGVLDARNAAHVIDALTLAADDALHARIDGLVTGPIHKGVVNDAGIRYTGTTELLAQRAGTEVVMMLASDTLRVALATTLLPLRAVPDAITNDGLTRTLRILHAALRRDFGLDAPRIAVLGLNPHAGEDGHLGREEIEVIDPAMNRLRDEGMTLIGPLPADTAFLPSKLAGFDAVLAMYHDQGLPVLKHGGFERAVNITLGLPYVRVAVDHGTALDLAGTGRADASSLILAANIAAQMAAARRTVKPL